MKHTAVWFDIPVTDMDRAVKFYSAVLQIEMQPFDAERAKMAFFPFDENSVSGALVQSEMVVPSEKGTTAYLNGGDDLNAPLSRIEAAGGQVLQEKMAIGEYGFVAYFLDTEGNKVALHSMS